MGEVRGGKELRMGFWAERAEVKFICNLVKMVENVCEEAIQFRSS